MKRLRGPRLAAPGDRRLAGPAASLARSVPQSAKRRRGIGKVSHHHTGASFVATKANIMQSFAPGVEQPVEERIEWSDLFAALRSPAHRKPCRSLARYPPRSCSVRSWVSFASLARTKAGSMPQRRPAPARSPLAPATTNCKSFVGDNAPGRTQPCPRWQWGAKLMSARASVPGPPSGSGRLGRPRDARRPAARAPRCRATRPPRCRCWPRTRPSDTARFARTRGPPARRNGPPPAR